MYPLYWTTSKEGVFMRYSYEYKKKCTELYREGKWPETPCGIQEEHFHGLIRKWARTVEANGPEVLQHTGKYRHWSPEEKLELVSEVLAGASILSVATRVGLDDAMLGRWVRNYKIFGYNGLVNRKKGRPAKEPTMKKKNVADTKPLTESEREELIRLRAEIEYIKAENEVIKKEIALREEEEAARLKAKKQRSSKNSGKKDSN